MRLEDVARRVRAVDWSCGTTLTIEQREELWDIEGECCALGEPM